MMMYFIVCKFPLQGYLKINRKTSDMTHCVLEALQDKFLCNELRGGGVAMNIKARLPPSSSLRSSQCLRKVVRNRSEWRLNHKKVRRFKASVDVFHKIRALQRNMMIIKLPLLLFSFSEDFLLVCATHLKNIWTNMDFQSRVRFKLSGRPDKLRCRLLFPFNESESQSMQIVMHGD